MPLKDYYELLQVQPGASEMVIKKAYRKLAMRFHPDRNVGNPYTVHHFREIQEAYDVLSNPATRSEYHQKRWLHPELAKPDFKEIELSTALIESEALKIVDYVRNLDVFRMNYDALYQLLGQLLNDRHLSVLVGENQEKSKKKIIELVFQSLQPLPYTYLKDIPARLVKIAGSDNTMMLKIHQIISNKRKQYLWERYRGILMLSIAFIICIIIYAIA